MARRAALAAALTGTAQLSACAGERQQGASLDVSAFGARGDGRADDSDAIRKALAALPDTGGVVSLPPGVFRVDSPIPLDGKRAVVHGSGPLTVLTTGEGTHPALTLSAHNQPPIVRDIRFTGSGTGIRCAMAPTTHSSLDLEVRGCEFRTRGTGIDLAGIRETTIADCLFDFDPTAAPQQQVGIRMTKSTNVLMRGCTFLHCATAILAAGTNSDFDGGPRVLDCTFLDNATAVHVEYSDYTSIEGCMIDYNDHPVEILGTLNPVVLNNYISSQNDNPAIVIGPGSQHPDQSTDGVRIIANTVMVHYNGSNNPDVAAVELINVHAAQVVSNEIVFWRKYGIRLGGRSSQNIYIAMNTIHPEPGHGAYSVAAQSAAADSDSNWCVFNDLVRAPRLFSAVTDANRYNEDNIAPRSTSRGTEVLRSGSATTNVVHGCGSTPLQVILTPEGPVSCWVENLGPALFTIRTSRQVDRDTPIHWLAMSGRSLIPQAP